MNATEFAKSEIRQSLDFLDLCVNGMTDEQYNWKPPGTCHPASKLHAHILYYLDFSINLVLGANASSWGEFAKEEGLGENVAEIWSADSAIALSPMQEYARGLQESVEVYFGSVSEADLDTEVDTRFLGTRSVAWMLWFINYHTLIHTGEIAAVKGMQGLKGLPI